jgi:hypothetical protein
MQNGSPDATTWRVLKMAGEGDSLNVTTNIPLTAAGSDCDDKVSMLETWRPRTVGLQYNNGMKTHMFWDRTPCILLNVNRRFGGMSRSFSESKNKLTCFILVSCLVCSSAPKMEAICSSENSVDYGVVSQKNIIFLLLVSRTLRNHGCENLKSYKKTDCRVYCNTRFGVRYGSLPYAQ